MKKNNISREMKLCFLPAVIIIIMHILKLTDENIVKYFMRFVFIAAGVYAVWTASNGRREKAVFLILFAGIMLRTGYTVYTDIFVRGHDIGMTSGEEAVGHYGYMTLVYNGHLPPSNEYQFYQPPLYYIVTSVFMRIASLFVRSESWEAFRYFPQIVSCVSSCIALQSLNMIMDELNIKNKTIPMLLTAVYPAQILAAGRMNNDAMVFMFIMLSLYATVRWAKERNMINIILIALFIGFGMMTKINCGAVALITGPVMLYYLAEAVRKKQAKPIVMQLIVFAVIVFPLGLWYPIRNLILFDQPINFVHILGEHSHVYTGDRSFAERWIRFPLFDFVNNPYMDMPNDANNIMSLIKTGVHGEFDWKGIIPDLSAWSIEYVHILLMIAALVSIIAVMLMDISKVQKWSVFAVWILFSVLYIYFNIQYKYICSADFRYVFPAQAAAAVFIAYMSDFLKKQDTRKVGFYALNGIVGVFCVMSVLHFI